MVLPKSFALLALLITARMANAVVISGTPQDLSTLFPASQGANGIFAQSRDIGTSNYHNLAGSGTFYGTPGAPFSIPSVFVRQPGQIELNPSATVQGGTNRDAALNVQLTGSGFRQIVIQGTTTAGDGGNPTAQWYIYNGANNWNAPIWSTASLGTPINKLVPYTPGMQLYFSTNALGNDVNDNACYSNLKVSGLPVHISITPDTGRGPMMTASFTPQVDLGMSLSQAAAAWGFTGFNWKQTINVWPGPSNLFAANNPNVPLTAPPPFSDPVPGGYTYAPGDNSFPFYYDANVDLPISGDTLSFSDEPMDPLLTPGSYLEFTTSLVGVLPGNTVGPDLFDWTWRDTYNGSVGGISFTKNILPGDLGSGTGEITLVVPEPSTGVMLIICIFAVLRSRSRGLARAA